MTLVRPVTHDDRVPGGVGGTTAGTSRRSQRRLEARARESAEAAWADWQGQAALTQAAPIPWKVAATAEHGEHEVARTQRGRQRMYSRTDDAYVIPVLEEHCPDPPMTVVAARGGRRRPGSPLGQRPRSTSPELVPGRRRQRRVDSIRSGVSSEPRVRGQRRRVAGAVTPTHGGGGGGSGGATHRRHDRAAHARECIGELLGIGGGEVGDLEVDEALRRSTDDMLTTPAQRGRVARLVGVAKAVAAHEVLLVSAATVAASTQAPTHPPTQARTSAAQLCLVGGDRWRFRVGGAGCGGSCGPDAL
jgi:hypothetical protein